MPSGIARRSPSASSSPGRRCRRAQSRCAGSTSSSTRRPGTSSSPARTRSPSRPSGSTHASCGSQTRETGNSTGSWSVASPRSSAPSESLGRPGSAWRSATWHRRSRNS
ncbi:hypothetical protein ACFPRL_23605 [Pseudoclavibacter helvolus]